MSSPQRSAVDRAFELLRGHVLHGTWPAGEKLPTEAALTAELGVSRTTVREALNRLASTGLIDAPHSGTRRVLDFRDHAGLEVLSALVVSPSGVPDLGVVRSVTEMRDAIAPDVARLAALRASDAVAADLLARAQDLRSDAGLDALLVATLDWWTELVLASDNLAYRLAYNTLRSTYMDGRAVLRDVIADELTATGLYVAISQAVVDRDADRARESTSRLVQLGAAAIFTAIG
jgi:DNA-binding FadR family transcriptional regulator